MYLFVKWKKGIVGGLLYQIGLILPFYQFLFFFHTKERDEDLFKKKHEREKKVDFPNIFLCLVLFAAPVLSADSAVAVIWLVGNCKKINPLINLSPFSPWSKVDCPARLPNLR